MIDNLEPKRLLVNFKNISLKLDMKMKSLEEYYESLDKLQKRMNIFLGN